MNDSNQIDLSKLRISRENDSKQEEHKQKRFGIFWYLIGAIFLIIAVFFFFKDSFTPAEIVELTTVTMVSPNQASSVLTASGYVVAQRKASIASKATGRLVYLGFEEGDKVKCGEIIARIESADVEAALNQARANLEMYKAQKHDAEQTYERAKKLIERQLISQAELDAAKSRYDQIIAAIKSADAAVRAAEVQLENTLIRAPFDGTILTKNADVGEVVAPFGAGASSRVAVVTIADMTSLEVEADVSESNIEKIMHSQPCEIVLDAYPEHRYKGFVNKIVPTADRTKATVLTKIRFINRDDRVLPEMSAKVYFLSKDLIDTVTTSPFVAVNSSAVTISNRKNVVFLFKDNKVEEVEIELGQKAGNMIEIKKGLSVGDKVVINPSRNLFTGRKVKLKQ